MTRLRDADDPRSRHLYYCYAADGTLLYVGQAMDVADRLYMHGHYSSPSLSWFLYCTRVEISPGLPDAATARAAEREAIKQLRPACNRHHNPNPQPWHPNGERRSYTSTPDLIYLDAEHQAA